MLYHAGVLDSGHSPMFERIKSQSWVKLPPEVKHNLDVALITPGFTHTFWSKNLKRSIAFVTIYRSNVDPDLRADAIENWNSITPESCLKISKIRTSKHIPVPMQIQIVSDIRSGYTWTQVQKRWNISETGLAKILRRPVLSDRTMPKWFRDLIPAA